MSIINKRESIIYAVTSTFVEQNPNPKTPLSRLSLVHELPQGVGELQVFL